MKKIVIPSAGGYEKLTIKEFPDLKAKNDEVVVDVAAIGINFADICVRLGVYESAKRMVGWPITPGFEVSGIISSVGPACTNFKVGERVMAFTFFDAYASQVCVSEKQLIKIPDHFTMLESAGFLAVFFTAYHALFQHIVLHPNSNVLIHSAAGGVGSALTQLSMASGFNVTGVIGSSHKKSYLENMGIHHIIDKSKEDLWQRARDIAPKGYHAVFDANGFSTLRHSYDHLCATGKLIAYGSHDLLPKKGGKLNYIKAGIGLLKTPSFKPLEMVTENKGVIGFNLSFLFEQQQLIDQCIQGLQGFIDKKQIKPLPITEFSFNEVAKAHEHIESGNSVGKIVLVV